MADLYLTIAQLEHLFWTTTMQIMGYTPEQIAQYDDADHPTPNSPVRISWPPAGAPAWKRTQDVVFLRIGEDDDPFSLLRDVIIEPKDEDAGNQQTGQTRVLRVHWVCYGPNSFDIAYKIYNRLFAPQIRQPLTDNQIYLVPSMRKPKRAPELFGGQWWDRTDYSAQFNALVQFNEDVPYFKSAQIEVVNQRGDTSNADVPAKN